MTDVLSRVAGAPITWGVDGSPGWGHLMDADRVLGEMSQIGLRATELGPDGYLPPDPDELADKLAQYGLELIGGFVPAVLYRAELEEENLAYFERASKTLAGCGSKVVVLGPSSHYDGYDTSIEMTDEEWSRFLDNLKRVIGIAGEKTAIGRLIDTVDRCHRTVTQTSAPDAPRVDFRRCGGRGLDSGAHRRFSSAEKHWWYSGSPRCSSGRSAV